MRMDADWDGITYLEVNDDEEHNNCRKERRDIGGILTVESVLEGHDSVALGEH